MAYTITRTAWIDDTGTGNDGTVINNAAKTELYNQIDTALADIGAPHCAVYHNAAQSLTSATETVLNMNSEDIDSGALHDTVTNNSRITIPTGGGGLYLVTATVTFAAAASGVGQAYIRKNGGTLVSSRTITPLNSATTLGVIVNWLIVLAAGDYVEVIAAQNSGGALNSGHATRDWSNQFGAIRLAKT